MAISKKSWLGVTREATSGTAITTPTLYVPTKSMIKAKKKQEFLDEERADRNGEYDVVDGVRHAEWDIKGPFYPDAHVYFLLAGMGGVTTTQPNSGTAPNVYKHTLALTDIPPSLTLMKSFDAKTYYTPYSVVEKFGIKFTSDGKLLEMDASGKAIWPTIQASPPTPSFSAVKPFSGYAPTVNLFNTATNDIDELQIEFEQKITLWNPANGVADWVTAYFGERKVSLSFTARFDNDTLYQRFKTGAYDMFSFDVLGALIQSTYNYELNVAIPVIYYTEMEHDLGKDNVLIKCKAKGLATSQTINAQNQVGTGNNLFSAFVQNSVSSYTV